VQTTDDVLLISLAVTCDKHRSAVGPVIYIVLWPSNGWLIFSVGSRPSVLHGT